ncbi:hypothetical protein [Sporocytophaga myxococcoides]|nr:hypothetical protein [Sporocytophaga myxococcoides]
MLYSDYLPEIIKKALMGKLASENPVPLESSQVYKDDSIRKKKTYREYP